MWDYVPTRFYLAGDVDAWRASDLTADGYDRVDPSPRDHQSSTCVICILSDTLDGRHVAKRGGMDLHRTGKPFPNRGHYAIMAICSPKAPSDGAHKTWKNPRSRSNRALIKPRSQFFRWGIVSNQSVGDRRRIRTTIVARSWPDRGAIVA